MKILVLILSLCSATAFADWTCDNGRDVEGAGISTDAKGLTGSVQWDCWPGGGICNAEAVVTESKNAQGDLVYKGDHFWLIIHISAGKTDGGYKGHLIATDVADDADMGKGLKFDSFVTCK